MGSIWEPACGEGHMAAVIAEFTSAVIASDVFDYGYGTAPHDFLYDDPLTTPDWIITNPPFSIACEFTLRALKLASTGVAMLVRTQWIEGGCATQTRHRTLRSTHLDPSRPLTIGTRSTNGA